MDMFQFLSVAVTEAWYAIPAHHLSLQAIAISLMLSLIGTALIIQVTGWPSWLTPVPYFLALMIGSLIAHRIIGAFPLPGMPPVHQLLMTTLIGMSIGSFAILATLRPSQK
jgi:hypothetical protein